MKKFKRKKILPDLKYNNPKITKLINYVMKDGKKAKARKIVYDALERIEKTTKKNPVDILNKAIQNAGPLLEVRPKRIGGATYQVPYEVKKERRVTLAMKWIISAARSRKGKSMGEKLAEEIIKASNGEGEAVKKRENMHKMAEANKAFAHFAF